jgi:hypothetical protein
MYFVLMDSTGNMLASYRELREARSALARIVEDDLGAEEDVAILSYDDDGAIADPSLTIPTEGSLTPLKVEGWLGVDLYRALLEPVFRQGDETEVKPRVPVA